VAGKDHISGSIGPFLRKRMREEKVFVSIQEVPERADIEQRAQAIKGRMSMGMVRFPTWIPCWPQMQKEILTFPNGAHDDVIACLAHIGVMLNRLAEAETPATLKEMKLKPMTLAAVKQNSAERKQRAQMAVEAESW